MMFSLEQLTPLDTVGIDYCRRGYGKHVIPNNPELILWEIPAAFVVRDERNNCIGRAALGYEPDPLFWVEQAGGKVSPWIYEVFVEEQFRDLGVGTALINHCLGYLATLDAVAVCLDTNTAGDWYSSKFGFIKSHSGEYENQIYDIYYRPITESDKALLGG